MMYINYDVHFLHELADRDRLEHYYGPDAHLRIFGPPAGVGTVLMRSSSEGSPITDRAQLVAFIERLMLDHYLVRSGDTDGFAPPLVQRARKAMRR